MRKRSRMTLTFVTAAALGIAALAQEASAEDATAQATYRDIEQTLGFVPSFFKLFPEAGIAHGRSSSRYSSVPRLSSTARPRS